MRIAEIASAEDQIALFKLVTDKVWVSLADQQRLENERKQKQKLSAKAKPQKKHTYTQPKPAAIPAPQANQPIANTPTLASQSKANLQASRNVVKAKQAQMPLNLPQQTADTKTAKDKNLNFDTKARFSLPTK